MELKDNLRKMIIKNNRFVDSFSLEYFINYFYAAITKNVIPQDVNLEELISNISKYRVVIYDEKSDIYKKYGPNVKGYRDSENKKIYVRYNLNEVLKEITIYHEIHHAVQTNIETDDVGINHDFNKCRMIMEAQTQYFAEETYKLIHGVNFQAKSIPSEKLRLKSGGMILSNLHNYELYDAMLSKLAIILDVSKDFFVYINYYYKDGKGYQLLKEKYEEAKIKYNLSFTFDEVIILLDKIYVTDLFLYSDEVKEIKQKLLLGQRICIKLYEEIDADISIKIEESCISSFDVELFLDLYQNNGNAKEFAKYIISNEKRSVATKYVSFDEQPSNGSGNSRK